MAQERWKSRFGLIAAAIGMAVGTGNIWRFPRISAANGGGSFVLVYIIAFIVWSIPLLMAEAVWGKATRRGVIGSFKEFLGERYTWMGGLVGWISYAIACYYAVVMGWCVRYFVYALTGVISPGVNTEALWNNFINSPAQVMTFHVISMIIATLIILAGVNKGLEWANKIMIPTLFVMLIVLVARALTLPGASKGLEFFFTPHMDRILMGKTWLEAFTQAAWSTGAGWALLLTYYVYARDDEDIALNCTLTCFADSGAALLAALAVIPTIFALSPDPMKAVGSGNTGLAFIHLTGLFSTMPGGTIVAVIFFLALIFAALSSLLSMLELATRVLIDSGWERTKAALVVGIVTTILGLPSSARPYFLENQDWVWGVGLLLSGMFFWYGAIKKGVDKLYEQYIRPVSDIDVPLFWKLIYLFPVWFAIIFGWWVYQAITWYPGEWWKPFPLDKYTYTVGTMLFQWAIAFIVIYALNNKLASWVKPLPGSSSNPGESQKK